MSETYREDAPGHQIAGGFLIGAASLVAAVAVIVSLYSWINPPGQLPPPASHPITLASRYLAIAVPGRPSAGHRGKQLRRQRTRQSGRGEVRPDGAGGDDPVV